MFGIIKFSTGDLEPFKTSSEKLAYAMAKMLAIKDKDNKNEFYIVHKIG